MTYRAEEHLYNSLGIWIAFRIDKYIFDTSGRWIGWIPWNNGHVVTVEGQYLGTIVKDPSGSRFYYFQNFQNQGYPGYPGYPALPGYPGYPGTVPSSSLPPMAIDVQLKESA